MNTEIKTKWIAALRSGNYKQGFKRLHYKGEWGDVYCCLGVLCELAIESNVPIRREPIPQNTLVNNGNTQGYGPISVSEYRNYNLLPDTVHEWSGLSYDESFQLSYHNDEGLPFTGIADIIERWM